MGTARHLFPPEQSEEVTSLSTWCFASRPSFQLEKENRQRNESGEIIENVVHWASVVDVDMGYSWGSGSYFGTLII